MFRAGIKWIWRLKGRIIVTRLLLEEQLGDLVTALYYRASAETEGKRLCIKCY